MKYLTNVAEKIRMAETLEEAVNVLALAMMGAIHSPEVQEAASNIVKAKHAKEDL